MALNFTVSYTFSPNTTISSSQVNTNTSDVANVFTGLEAVTKSFARLQVDAAPTVAADVVRKDYVDHYSGYRRPVLQFGSVTTVAVESGIDGTSGDIPILFPDGQLRTETSTTRTTFNITRNAVLTTSGAQSGLTGATSEASNTWYALYAAKVTDSSSQWVTVGSTVLPIQSNFSTLNTAYGANGWVYLGLIRNGDNSAAGSDILNFTQVGNTTLFTNSCAAGTSVNAFGIDLASNSSSTSVTYTYAAGSGASQIPNNIKLTRMGFNYLPSSTTVTRGSVAAAAPYFFVGVNSVSRWVTSIWKNAATDTNAESAGNTSAIDILLEGFIDGVLGVGSNPLL